MSRLDEHSLSFFHGALLDEDVDKLLVSEGDYLIQTKYDRGHTRPKLYLAIRHGSSTRRVDIQRTENGFRLNGRSFNDVRQLVDHCVAKGVELVHRDIKLQKKIGSGAYGTVYKGVLVKDRCPVAVKRIDSDNKNEQGLVEMMKEARVMQLYDHSNIVKFYGYIVDRTPYLLVMELCQDGSVEDKLRTAGKHVSTARRVDMGAQAARGLEYLHQKNCIHRDIATRNCLLAGSVLKLADFGMCRATAVYKIDLAKPQNVRWLAPEVWRSGETRFCTDVYAFAIMLWELFEIPYSSPYSAWKAITVKEKVMAGYRMPTPDSMPDLVCTLMKRCWDHDPSKRPTAAEVRKEFDAINKEFNDEEVPQTANSARLEASSPASGRSVSKVLSVIPGISKAKSQRSAIVNSRAQSPKRPPSVYYGIRRV
uniref:Tyrosine-protein kinase n=1 Tax=Steinernema glaseri TaxID=37863 RepID=A0A1I8AC11_9BILA